MPAILTHAADETMKYQSPSRIDLLSHGYAYISARPVGASASAKSVIMQPENVCLLVAG